MLQHAVTGIHHQLQCKAPLINSCNNSITTQCCQLDKLASNLSNLKTLLQVEWMLLVAVAEDATQHIKTRCSTPAAAALTSPSG
jgi:hypothetical protein